MLFLTLLYLCIQCPCIRYDRIRVCLLIEPIRLVPFLFYIFCTGVYLSIYVLKYPQTNLLGCVAWVTYNYEFAKWNIIKQRLIDYFLEFFSKAVFCM